MRQIEVNKYNMTLISAEVMSKIQADTQFKNESSRKTELELRLPKDDYYVDNKATVRSLSRQVETIDLTIDHNKRLLNLLMTMLGSQK